jgi:hypothetical protein
MASMASTS